MGREGKGGDGEERENRRGRQEREGGREKEEGRKGKGGDGREGKVWEEKRKERKGSKAKRRWEGGTGGEGRRRGEVMTGEIITITENCYILRAGCWPSICVDGFDSSFFFLMNSMHVLLLPCAVCVESGWML